MDQSEDANLIALTMGDPAGCGPLITKAAWQSLHQRTDRCFFVIGWPGLYTGVPVRLIDSPSEAVTAFPNALPVLPLADEIAIRAGRPDPRCAAAILSSITEAVRIVLLREASAIVTNPVSKALLYGEGFGFPGHTEFIASLCAPKGHSPPEPVMMLTGGGLRVALATIHIPYREVPAALSDGRLLRIARITARALREDFGIKDPRLAFTGLNPHAGEAGTIGREEAEIINPAAEALRREGISITDARPGDTVFAEMREGAFDGVIAMTHDQGLIPVKTLDFWGGVNTTLGLPLIRTSPDHGTAYDAAAQGSARADSLLAAIGAAAFMAGQRAGNKR